MKYLKDYVYFVKLNKIGDKKYSLLKPSFKYWYADPFTVNIYGKEYLFTEQYDRIIGKGKIAISLIKDSGKIGKPKTVIDEPFHLSFPNVFEFDGNYYMIPESVGGKDIRIYKMGKDVYSWSLYRRLDIDNCVDTAIKKDGKNLFLLTCFEREDNKLYNRLKLFFMENFPDGKITECNGAVGNGDFTLTDRNAGNIFFDGGKTYRACQISTENYYGIGYEIREISELNKTGFSEKPLSKVLGKDTKIKANGLIPLGSHTFNKDEKFEVVDFSGYSVTLKNLLLKALKKIKGNK